MRSWTPRAALVAAAILGALTSCNRVPLTAPSGSSLTLLISTNVLGVNGTADLTAVILEGAQSAPTTGADGEVTAGVGTPVHDGTLVVFTTSLGRVEPAEARTTNGRVTVKLIGDGRSGVAKVTAYSGPANNTLEVDIGAAGATRVAVTASPQALPPNGGQSVISARVEDLQGNGITGVPVSFSTTKGTLSATTVSTNEFGIAQTTLTTTSEATVTAGTGGSATALTGNVIVTLKPAGTVTIALGTGTPSLGVPVTFTITPGSTVFINEVKLDFGDGTGEISLGRVTAAMPVSHLYRRSGEHTVTAKVIDGDNNTTTVSTRVAVLPIEVTLAILPAPTALIPKIGDTVTFVITPANSAASIDRTEWDFGDGESQTTQSRTIAHTYKNPPGPGVKVVIARVFAAGAVEARELPITIDVKP